MALLDVRRRYDDLMDRAAAAPGSSLGQQLYATRVHARLSAQEVANGAGLRTDLLDDLEAGETPTEEEAAKVKVLIAALGGCPVPNTTSITSIMSITSPSITSLKSPRSHTSTTGTNHWLRTTPANRQLAVLHSAALSFGLLRMPRICQCGAGCAS